MDEYQLFFGRNLAGTEVVSDTAWEAFLSDQITPRFPDGLTVIDAVGQWRESGGTIERERTKLVVVLTPPGSQGLQSTDQLIKAYKKRFRQSAVLRRILSVCASF